MAERINRAIELLAQGQPIYYTGGHTGSPWTADSRPSSTLTAHDSPLLTHEQGTIDAATWADFINVGFEHGAYDLAGLQRYLGGLVDGGPTRSGHRTPTIIVEAPVGGYSREVMQANLWQFQQILGRGAHGIMLCQATTADAVRAFVEACRYPVNRLGVGAGLGVGMRGVGSERSAAHIWGVDRDTYLATADPWPLNPDGDLLLGVKIESRAAIPHIEEILAVPGVGYAEMGPGDMSLSLGYRSLPDPWPDEMVELHRRVQAACREHGVAFHWTHKSDDLRAMIDRGAQVFTCPNADFAAAGRAHSKRTMPV